MTDEEQNLQRALENASKSLRELIEALSSHKSAGGVFVGPTSEFMGILDLTESILVLLKEAKR